MSPDQTECFLKIRILSNLFDCKCLQFGKLSFINRKVTKAMGGPGMSKKKPSSKRVDTTNLKAKKLADGVLEKIKDVNISELVYPKTVKTKEQKFYFDAILLSCANLSLLFHDPDKFLIAKLARLMVVSDKLLDEGENEPVIDEMNGNTGIPQKKANPNLSMFVQIDRRIDVLIKQLGLSPAARADIYNKMIVLKDDNVLDSKTAKVVNEDDMIPGIYAVGSNAKNPLRKLG